MNKWRQFDSFTVNIPPVPLPLTVNILSVLLPLQYHLLAAVAPCGAAVARTDVFTISQSLGRELSVLFLRYQLWALLR